MPGKRKTGSRARATWSTVAAYALLQGVLLKLVCLLNSYPQPQHGFIRRELQALERDGHSVLRLAMGRPPADLPDPQDHDEATATEYLSDCGAGRLTVAVLRAAIAQPAGFVAALQLAIRMGRASPGGILRGLVDLGRAAQVARRCAREGVQHVHAHSGRGPATVALLANVLGAPGFSLTVPGPEEFDAPAALSLPLKLRRAAFAVGVSQFGRAQLCRWTDVAAWSRLHVIRCGVDPSALAGAPVPFPSGTLRLVSIGGLNEPAGQMVLIEALARLQEAVAGFHLSLVGDGRMRPVLERAISERGLADRVTLTGWLSEADRRGALDRAHALVLPGLAEGPPVAAIEALAAGRPVIATHVAGIPELVRPGSTGWLVPPGDAQALADAITEMAATPAARLSQMGQAGRQLVLERHDSGKEAARLASLLRRSVAGGA